MNKLVGFHNQLFHQQIDMKRKNLKWKSSGGSEDNWELPILNTQSSSGKKAISHLEVPNLNKTEPYRRKIAVASPSKASKRVDAGSPKKEPTNQYAVQTPVMKQKTMKH